MQWIIIAILAYFFLALSQVLDKFLLSERIPRPAVYAFYVGLLSLFTLFYAPFGLHLLEMRVAALSLISGVTFIYGILFLYYGVKASEVSRIIPLTGAILTIATFLLAVIFLQEEFSVRKIFGLVLLLSGGLLISFDLPIKSKKIFAGFQDCVIAGIFLAFAYIMFDLVYADNINFISGFVWTRLGIFAGSLSLLLMPKFRQEIINSFRNFGQNKKRNLGSTALFVANKLLGGSHAIIIGYAIKLGSVTTINALGSIQYVFVLALSAGLALKYPKLFREKLFFWDWAQKIGAVTLIGLGVVLISV